MKNAPYKVDSITGLHKLFFLPPPSNPLITIIDLKGRHCMAHADSNSLVFDFYSVWFKKDASGILGYGQRAFDFGTGALTFQAPGQVISVHDHHFSAGWGLAFHPDLLQGYPLQGSIKQYSFFSYDVYHGLCLSEQEENAVHLIINDIAAECEMTDHFGRPVLVALLELLLTKLHRFYHRQFQAIEKEGNGLLTSVEKVLDDYFNTKHPDGHKLLTVKFLADQLHLSPHHLSDKLKEITGISAQQHIHLKMIEKAKHLLSATALSISEVSFLLGFEHMQSFSKVFKKRTGQTPREYRGSLCTTMPLRMPA